MNTKLGRVRKGERGGTKETEEEWSRGRRRARRVVCMEVKGNKCLKKEAVVLHFQCYRVGPQDKAEE